MFRPIEKIKGEMEYVKLDSKQIHWRNTPLLA